MAKNAKKLDGQLTFDWESRVADYVETKTQLINATHQRPEPSELSIEDACAEVAMAVKRALRRSGLSREQLLDGINGYFGTGDEDEDASRKTISIHMLNHYLSKPVEYPLPAYLLIPIIYVLESFDPAQAVVEPVGGRVISEGEVRLMTLGKLETTISEMQRLKRELRKG